MRDEVQKKLAALEGRLRVSLTRDAHYRTQNAMRYGFWDGQDRARTVRRDIAKNLSHLQADLLRRLAQSPQVSWHDENSGLAITVAGEAPIDRVALRLSKSGGKPNRIALDVDGDGRLGDADFAVPFSRRGEDIVLHASWLANRIPRPATALYTGSTGESHFGLGMMTKPTRFSLVFDRAVEVLSVRARHALTEKQITGVRTSLPSYPPSRWNRPVTQMPPASEIVWHSDIALEGTTIIDRPLRIEPGTSLKMAPGANLIVRGKLTLLGQAGKPVRIVPAGGGAWGTFALQGSATRGSVIHHLEARGGSGAKVEGIQLGNVG